MKKFFLGTKALIKNEKGILIIKHAGGWWDMPGGRLEEGEDLEGGLARELKEELPGCREISINEQLGTSIVHKNIEGNVSLALVFFRVELDLPENLNISEEHTEFKWIKSKDEIPKSINPNMRELIELTL